MARQAHRIARCIASTVAHRASRVAHRPSRIVYCAWCVMDPRLNPEANFYPLPCCRRANFFSAPIFLRTDFFAVLIFRSTDFSQY